MVVISMLSHKNKLWVIGIPPPDIQPPCKLPAAQTL